MKPTVLFVCIENSCRSQMAEGFAKKWGTGLVEAFSAGSRPSGVVNPKAIAYMKEKDVDLTTHKSKGLTDLPSQKWDYVFTMGCGDACPFVPSKKMEDWAVPDPKNLPPEEFRRIRDDIELRVKNLLTEIKNQDELKNNLRR